MNTLKIINQSPACKSAPHFETFDGEVLSGEDRCSRKARISGALNLAYVYAGMTGGRKVQLAVLDAINACRGL